MCPALVALVLIAFPDNAKIAAQHELDQAKNEYLAARRTNRGLADAAFNYGFVVLNSPVLKPKEKYPLALALFRQTSKLDPSRNDTKKWEQTIVSIYEDMGREVHEADLNEIK